MNRNAQFAQGLKYDRVAPVLLGLETHAAMGLLESHPELIHRHVIITEIE